MESARLLRRAALFLLGGSALFLLLLRLFRPPAQPRRPSAGAGPLLAAPAAKAGPQLDPPGQTPASLVEPSETLGIQAVLPRQEKAPYQSFSGDILGQPASREQAEAYLRRLSSLSQKLERANSTLVPLEGEVVPLLQSPPKGGSALGELEPRRQ